MVFSMVGLILRMFFNALGPGYTAGNDYWTQFRMQKGGLFAQAYYNYVDGGDSSDPTFLYGTGLRQLLIEEV